MKTLFTLILPCLLCVPWFPSVAAPAKPNVIFILADDLGYGDLGCYGQKQIQTPCLDRMAAEGMRFTQFYAGATVCAPSRCVLMTGKHTGHCWVRGNAMKNNLEIQTLRPEDMTVAKLMKQAGYATALIGKWGLGEGDSTGIPRKQGFDYFYGYMNQVHAHNYYPAFLWRNETRVPLKNEVPGEGEYGQGWASKKVEYSHDLIAAEAFQWIEKHASTSSAQRKPFFLYFAVTIPHANNEATRGTGDGQEVPDYGIYKDKDWPNPAKGQAAMITRMDADIGRLFALLKKLKLDDNTLVLFSSDNGPHKEGGNPPTFFQPSGPLRGTKRDLYDGGIRVPFIARWPGHVKAGSVNGHIGYFGDFMATAAELAGIKLPSGFDSISFAPTLLDRPQRQHEYLYWEFHEGGFKQAVRLGEWKAVRLGVNKPIELYNVKSDLGEQHDVAAQHPDLIERFTKTMATARTDAPNWPVRKGGK